MTPEYLRSLIEGREELRSAPVDRQILDVYRELLSIRRDLLASQLGVENVVDAQTYEMILQGGAEKDYTIHTVASQLAHHIAERLVENNLVKTEKRTADDAMQSIVRLSTRAFFVDEQVMEKLTNLCLELEARGGLRLRK